MKLSFFFELEHERTSPPIITIIEDDAIKTRPNVGVLLLQQVEHFNLHLEILFGQFGSSNRIGVAGFESLQLPGGFGKCRLLLRIPIALFVLFDDSLLQCNWVQFECVFYTDVVNPARIDPRLGNLKYRNKSVIGKNNSK